MKTIKLKESELIDLIENIVLEMSEAEVVSEGASDELDAIKDEMKAVNTEYKAAEGDEKVALLNKLKELTAKKKAKEEEIEDEKDKAMADFEKKHPKTDDEYTPLSD